jgi:hypothetical protein
VYKLFNLKIDRNATNILQLRCMFRVGQKKFNNSQNNLNFIPSEHASIANNSSSFNEFVCKLGLFWHESTSAKKKAQFTQERVEYNVFLFDEPLKDFKSLKIFKISLTFRFDKLSNLSKSVHTGENSQILTVSNKKKLSESPNNSFQIFLQTYATNNANARVVIVIWKIHENNQKSPRNLKIHDAQNIR